MYKVLQVTTNHSVPHQQNRDLHSILQTGHLPVKHCTVLYCSLLWCLGGRRRFAAARCVHLYSWPLCAAWRAVRPPPVQCQGWQLCLPPRSTRRCTPRLWPCPTRRTSRTSLSVSKGPRPSRGDRALLTTRAFPLDMEEGRCVCAQMCCVCECTRLCDVCMCVCVCVCVMHTDEIQTTPPGFLTTCSATLH